MRIGMVKRNGQGIMTYQVCSSFVLQEELNEKSSKLIELNKTKAEIEKLKREKLELKESIEAESAISLNKKLSEEKEKIRRTEEEKHELIKKEFGP